jgi:hypothetical protein
MRVLQVPGARLYYETHSSGPLMLMNPGVNGAADIKRVTGTSGGEPRSCHCDRGGFSRSQLDGLQDYDHRLETEADDVRVSSQSLAHPGKRNGILTVRAQVGPKAC